MKKQKIAIIGVGLLGGSLALALKNKGVSLVGWNHRASSRRKAARILPVAKTIGKAVEGADVIVLCSHTGAALGSLKALVTLVSSEALILDVSSVKGEVVREAARIPGMKYHFVPCHPMAGKEKSGAAFADAGLYQNKFVFITPLDGSPPGLVEKAASFWRRVGAFPVRMSAKGHDRNVALTSHLPHLLACALVDIYGKRQRKDSTLSKAVGSGFRDFTRIAAGNPAMWSDIMRLNSEEVRGILFLYRKRLEELENLLKKGSRGKWLEFFERTRDLREKL